MYLSSMKQLNTVNVQRISCMSNFIHWLDPLFNSVFAERYLKPRGK